MANKVICTISNYDKDNEALQIASQLKCPTYIVDSSGKAKEGFYPTDTPFFAGCFNKACELFLNADATHCLFICSDVLGDIQAVIDKIISLPQNIALYSPAVNGQGWHHEKPFGTGLRDVPFCEGMIICFTKAIIQQVYPENAILNPHAFGFDIYLGYVANVIFGKRVVIDNDIVVFHPFGTSYDSEKGRQDMISYIHSKGTFFVQWVKNHIETLPYS